MRDDLSPKNFVALVEVCKKEGIKVPGDDGKDYRDTPEGRRNLRILIRKSREAKAAAEAEKEATTTKATEAEDASEKVWGLPWWAWTLILVAVVLLLWGVSHPRSTVDLSPIQASIGQLSTKVDALGQNITDLNSRMTALEHSAEVGESEESKEAPIVEPAVAEEPDLVEIGTGEVVALGLRDPKANPTVIVEPGQGVLWSSDPGGANASGQTIDYEKKGSMGYIFNASNKPIDVVFHTSWNIENGRWNISPVLFKVNDLKALREHTLTINRGEQKPLFFGKIWNGSELLNDPDL